jgi:hypothetical protein
VSPPNITGSLKDNSPSAYGRTGGANEVATEFPGFAEGGISLYSRAFVLSNITWKFGMFLGPLVSGALTKSVGYYAMNLVLGKQHYAQTLGEMR